MKYSKYFVAQHTHIPTQGERKREKRRQERGQKEYRESEPAKEKWHVRHLMP